MPRRPGSWLQITLYCLAAASQQGLLQVGLRASSCQGATQPRLLAMGRHHPANLCRKQRGPQPDDNPHLQGASSTDIARVGLAAVRRCRQGKGAEPRVARARRPPTGVQECLACQTWWACTPFKARCLGGFAAILAASPNPRPPRRSHTPPARPTHLERLHRLATPPAQRPPGSRHDGGIPHQEDERRGAPSLVQAQRLVLPGVRKVRMREKVPLQSGSWEECAGVYGPRPQAPVLARRRVLQQQTPFH